MSNRPQKHYSPEEMIRAAQAKRKEGTPSREKTTKEVITQEDGTKVIRVRKKRRKSGQSSDLLDSKAAGKSFYARLLWVSLIVLALVSVTFFGVFFFKMGYYNSPTHIAAVEQALFDRFGLKASLKGHHFGPNASTLDQVQLESQDPATPYYHLRASRVEIPHRPESVIIGPLRGEPLSIESAVLSVDYQREITPSPPSSSSSAGFKNPYGHDGASIKQLDFVLQGSQGQPAAAVRNTNTRLFLNQKGHIQILAKQGQLDSIPGLPAYLETASALLRGNELQINSLKLSNQSYGFLEIQGSYALHSKDAQTLNCTLSNLRMEGLSAAVDSFIEARVSSDRGDITLFPLKNNYRVRTKLTASTNGIALKNFQFLETLGTKFGDLNYPFVSFRDAATARAVFTRDSLTLSGLQLEKEGFLAVEGELEIAHETGGLQGTLQVGVPALKIAQAYPNANQERWTIRRGYAWFDITLSGEASNPQDTFEEVFRDLVEF